MKRKILLRVLVFSLALVLVVSLSLIGCTTPSQQEEEEEEDEYINVGCVVTLSGPAAAAGMEQRWGFELAVAELNANGGVLGKPLELYVRDDAGSASTMAKECEKLVTKQKVPVLVGCTVAACAEAMLEQAIKFGVTMIESNAVMITQNKYATGEMLPINHFNSMQTDENLVLAGATFIVDELDVETAYIIAADYLYGHEGGPLYELCLEAGGVEVVGIDYAPWGTVDYGPILANVKAANPDVLVNVLWGDDGPNCINHAYALGLLDDMVVYQDCGQGYTFEEPVTPEALPFTYWGSGWYWEVDTPQAQTFSEAFIDRYGIVPSYSAWGSYVALMHWANAVEEVGNLDIAQIEAGMASAVGDYGTGSYTFRGWDNSPIMTSYVLKGKNPDDIEHPERWDLLEIVATMAGEEYKLTREELSEYPPILLQWPRK